MDINIEDENGTTPLYFACEEGHIEVVKYLVKQGANINKRNNDGITPLSIACQERHIEVVKKKFSGTWNGCK